MAARTLLVLMMFATPLAFGQTEAPPAPAECTYHGEEFLHCDGDIVVPPGTLVTGAKPVTLITPRDIHFGTPENGLTITCADAAQPSADAACGNVEVFASTLHGSLNIDATAPNHEPGRVEMKVGFYAKTFRQNLKTDEGHLLVWRAGKDRSNDDSKVRWASR